MDAQKVANSGKGRNGLLMKIIVTAGILFVVLNSPYLYISGFVWAQEPPLAVKNEQVKGFVMTITDAGGEEKAVVAGSTANVLPDGVVEIKDVLARIYGEKKDDSDTIVHTSLAYYDRARNIISTDKFIRINRRGMVVTGTGMEWLPDKSHMEIKENVRIEYFRDAETEDNMEASLPERKKAVITAVGRGMIDYDHNIAVLKKNVMIEDAQVKLKAHNVKIHLSGSDQDLERVEAYGDVRIKQQYRESSSRKAVYHVKEDKIVLTGRPKIVSGFDSYSAEQIIIFDKGNRVVFKPRAELVIYESTVHEDME